LHLPKIEGSWEVPPIFKWLQEKGAVEDAEMRRTFNMGIGMVLIVAKDVAESIVSGERGSGKYYVLGHITKGVGVTYQ
jgi:phosphoribosylformylglycinamidine cyclo-ligase